MAVDEENLPFWCVNLPRESWPDKCPDFLKNVSDKDRGIISTRDENYHRQTWPEVKDIISTIASVVATMREASLIIKPQAATASTSFKGFPLTSGVTGRTPGA